ncbi:hypothetical protein CRC_00273 [Cylindrospermopsis raciborskii CS-505]|nr:hypothetical protein CRC_00273 [Cylindrospermopsis raciborskii CS-505]
MGNSPPEGGGSQPQKCEKCKVLFLYLNSVKISITKHKNL